MQKIGILTFHKSPNYGAIIQAFALQTYLQKVCVNNCKVNVIDYSCTGNDKCYEPDSYLREVSRSQNRIYSMIKLVLAKINVMPSYISKHGKFSDFTEKYLSMIPFDDSIDSVFDVIYLGSDQIWNPNITKGFQNVYFGKHPYFSRSKKVSYAASCGDITEFSKDDKANLYARISNVDFIGVREQNLHKELLQRNIKSTHTVDPSFLLSEQEYREKFSLSCEASEKYILEYALQNSASLDSAVEEIAQKSKLKVIKLCGYQNLYKKPSKGEIFDAGPVDFLKLISNAEYVVTNSFHGVAFSLIFHKNFNVILPASRKARIYSLLSDTNLTDRIITETGGNLGEIDYSLVQPLLDDMILVSERFIAKTLEGL